MILMYYKHHRLSMGKSPSDSLTIPIHTPNQIAYRTLAKAPFPLPQGKSQLLDHRVPYNDSSVSIFFNLSHFIPYDISRLRTCRPRADFLEDGFWSFKAQESPNHGNLPPPFGPLAQGSNI